MTSAHAEPLDFAAASEEVSPGHAVTVHPAGRPALRLVTPADWAVAELYRAFVTVAPLEALDPSAGLATGREPGAVYSRVFREVGCTFGEAEKRAIQLVRVVDEVLAELYDALGADADPVPVVPQLRADLLRAARVERVEVLREAGWPAEWVDAASTESEWLHSHPSGDRTG